MYSTPVSPVDLSFSYLRSAVEASLDIKQVQVEPNNWYIKWLDAIDELDIWAWEPPPPLFSVAIPPPPSGTR